MNKNRIAISGADGRMGINLLKAINNQKDIYLSAALVKKGSLKVGYDIGELLSIPKTGIKIHDDLNNVIESFDILIDFTNPKSTLEYLHICHKYKKSMVIGTTGFDKLSKLNIYNASKDIAIVFSANFSIGMNLVLKLLEKTTKVMGNSADIEILEFHHSHKIDSPSGTALEMGKTIANIMNWDFNNHVIYNRQGLLAERKKKTIGILSLRAGDVVGEHTAIFADKGERIEITHKVSDRMIFAKGAIKAATWLKNKQTGLFNMFDVIN
ncbi:MAG: 4-hydroxy-tetrahydrodipicolinate reductase [Pantoea sp. Brub]|nr:4-hydroxy-tetrahydrodipicolinate reductase [Pantoea sp. Brub]